jgi:hypothetical protein
VKIISHRGNICGPLLDKENRPSYIDCAIGNGYDVEIDVRLIDGELWLGHDEPQYKVDYTWLSVRKEYLWIHCKNVESAYFLNEYRNELQYFCHQSDPFTLTSTGHLWVHDLIGTINNLSIIPLINKESVQKYNQFECYGICTDYPSLISI